jgi:iron(III) transport system ATP-binding protein
VLSIERLRKSFGAGRRCVEAVRDVTLDVAAGSVFTLLGPSGCGKTTTLRCVAGLERADAGVISLAGEPVSDPHGRIHVPAHRRGLGMVFQTPTVWPHMTVGDNVAFPLVTAPLRERLTRREAARRVGAALELVRLEGLEGRAATDLSGGQQQRLTLARALVREPRVLLLDEPLSALDARLREEIREDLRRIQEELGLTALYVTHDQHEALSLSHRVGVMRDGRIEQVGTPREIYERPANAFVAELVGAANLLPGVVSAVGNGRLVVQTDHGPLELTADGVPRTSGERVMVVARPESIRLDPAEDEARVVAHAYLGDTVEIVVHAHGRDLRVRVAPREGLEPGASVGVSFDTERLSVLAQDDRAR